MFPYIFCGLQYIYLQFFFIYLFFFGASQYLTQVYYKYMFNLF